jgi:Lamin Tail Domain
MWPKSLLKYSCTPRGCQFWCRPRRERSGCILVAQNTIIAHNAVAPITVDSLSSVTVDYSLSDGTALAGTGNVVADPLFTSPAGLNYQLLPGSPAIDAGNPSHPPDSDGTQPDIGARYVYSAADYPFTIGETVVINEIMANSGVGSDWIELHNRTSTPMDVSGWFLSDDGADLRKYRLGAGTDCLPHLPGLQQVHELVPSSARVNRRRGGSVCLP